MHEVFKVSEVAKSMWLEAASLGKYNIHSSQDASLRVSPHTNLRLYSLITFGFEQPQVQVGAWGGLSK